MWEVLTLLFVSFVRSHLQLVYLFGKKTRRRERKKKKVIMRKRREKKVLLVATTSPLLRPNSARLAHLWRGRSLIGVVMYYVTGLTLISGHNITHSAHRIIRERKPEKSRVERARETRKKIFLTKTFIVLRRYSVAGNIFVWTVNGFSFLFFGSLLQG